MGKWSRDENDCLAIGGAEFDFQQRSNTKSLLNYNDRTYSFSLLYRINCIMGYCIRRSISGVTLTLRMKETFLSVVESSEKLLRWNYRRNSYSPGQSCIHKPCSASLFRRAEEGHDSHCVINTWTSIRYIERMVLYSSRRSKICRSINKLENYIYIKINKFYGIIERDDLLNLI